VGASVARGEVRSDVNYPAWCLGQVRDCRWVKVHDSLWAAVAERAQRVEHLPHQVWPPLDDCQRVACRDALLQHRLVSARVPAPDEAVFAGLVAILQPTASQAVQQPERPNAAAPTSAQ
jgi:hypothetical protein